MARIHRIRIESPVAAPRGPRVLDGEGFDYRAEWTHGLSPVRSRQTPSRFGAILTGVLALLAFVCASTPRSAVAKLNVVVTVPALENIVHAVGGDVIETHTIGRPTQDPHFVEAKPSEMLRLAKADLLFLGGLSLEAAWLTPLIQGSRNPKVQIGAAGYVDCSSFAKVIDVPTKVDRSQGDIHPGGDPHYLMSPRNGQRVAIGVYKALVNADPAHTNQYKANLVRFLRALRAKSAQWQALFKPLAGKPLISYHRSVKYLAYFLGLKMLVELEPKPGIPPSPGHLLKVIEVSKANHATVILHEVYYPQRTATYIVGKIGGTVVVFENGQHGANRSYIRWLDDIVQRLHKAYTRG